MDIMGDTTAHVGGETGAPVFVGCGSASAAGGGAPRPSPRRYAALDGKRVKTVDVHAHCVIPKALELMGSKVDDSFGPGIGELGKRRTAEMDAQGIDVEGVSINPNWYHLPRDLAVEVVRLNNETLAAWCGEHPDRFVGFASLALQHPEVAVEQLVDAVRRLGLRGAAIGGHVNGEEFADARFHPVWAKAEELGTLLFIHPQSTPELARRFTGNGWLANTIGNPLDTTIALSHLIFEGTLDEFPGLKILFAQHDACLDVLRFFFDDSLQAFFREACFIRGNGKICAPKENVEILREEHHGILHLLDCLLDLTGLFIDVAKTQGSIFV